MALKECPSFPGYSVNDKGDVFSHRTRKPIPGQRGGSKAIIDKTVCKKLSKNKTKKGYLVVSAKKAGNKPRNFGVHQLVADAFLGPKPNLHEIRHLDGNPSNNSPENLSYGTAKQNAQDRKRHGNYFSGEDHHNAKLTNKDAIRIRTLRKKGLKVKRLANQFHVSVATIESIIYNKSYSQI
ncbi:MAG: HNH endonuclease [Allomuricauda sp.]